MSNPFLLRLTSFFTGNLGTYIQVALLASAITFVGFLWFSRANALADLDKCQKANIQAQAQLAQITADIQDVRVKQEKAIQERDEIKKSTEAMVVTIKKQKLPTDCKELVKWAAKNKDDTKW